MPLQVFQQLAQSAGVLGANPVELEAVGHAQGQALLILGELRGQGFDPSIELLFRQFARQFIDARLPQGMAGIGLVFWEKSLGHVVFFLWTGG
jgi:hypothetical protein